MGKRKTRSEQTNKPIYEAQITGAAGAQQDAFDKSMPAAMQLSGTMSGAANDLFGQFAQDGNALGAANKFLVNELSGDPAQNPYLDQMLDISNNRVQNQMQAAMGRRGLTGGSDYTNLIGRALAENETGMRFQDYNNAMQRRMQAAGMSALPMQAAGQIGQAGVMLPSQLAALNSAGIGGLLGQYQDVKGTQTQSGGLLGSILSGATQLGSAALMACDVRLKENIIRVGKTPGGVPVYKFDYRGGAKGVFGPMAHEVAILQPEALGPEIDGYLTVDMGALQ